MFASGHRFVILCPEPDHPVLKDVFTESCFHFERLATEELATTQRGSRLRSFLVLTRRFTYGNTHFSENGCRHSNIAAFRAEQIAKASRLGRFYYRTILLAARLASRFAWFRQVLQWLDSRTMPFNGHAELYAKYDPSFAIVTSLGFDTDTLVMREARQHGCEIIAVIKNWDVPTTRGIGGEIPHHVLAWNDVMKREVVRYHDVHEERVHICGISQWDDYFNKTPMRGREAFLRHYGLSPARHVVYFAMTTPTHYHHNIRLTRILLNAIRDGRVKQPAQLLVRLHPAYISFDRLLTDEVREELKGLEAEFDGLLSFSYPTSEGMNHFQVPTARNDTDLKEILSYCDVLVTVYSTQILEGIIFDRPVINAGLFDFRQTGLPITTYENWDHIRQVLDREAVAYCYDEDEVIRGINADLANPERLAAGRKRIKDELLIPALCGKGGVTTADILIRLMNNHDKGAV